MTLYLPNGRVIRLSPATLGEGAEGKIFRLENTDDLCAKIYYDPTGDTAERLAAMLVARPSAWRGDHAEHMHVAWPREILSDQDGRARGFLMPLVPGRPLTHLFDPLKRLAAVEAPTWRVVVTVAARVARLLAMLHDAGIVVGDLSPANLVLSRTGHVTLVDCDTVQFTDVETGKLHRCTKLTPEYAAPELTGGAVAALLPGHDDFALATLLCQLLMEGEHPFEGVPAAPDAPDLTAADNIRLQNNRLLFPERFRAVADGMPLDVLPPRVLDLARACFGDGHRDHGARPTATDWSATLDQIGFQLMGCRLNERHTYHQSLQSCLWCAKSAAGHGDHFPAPGIPTVVIPQPAAVAPAGAWRTAWTPPPPPHPVITTPRTRPQPVPGAPRPAVPQQAQPAKKFDAGAVVATLAVIFFVIIVIVAMAGGFR